MTEEKRKDVRKKKRAFRSSELKEEKTPTYEGKKIRGKTPKERGTMAGEANRKGQ